MLFFFFNCPVITTSHVRIFSLSLLQEPLRHDDLCEFGELVQRMSSSCAAAAGNPPSSTYDSPEVNEWSGLLNYEQEVAVVNPVPFTDAINYSPLITAANKMPAVGECVVNPKLRIAQGPLNPTNVAADPSAMANSVQWQHRNQSGVYNVRKVPNGYKPTDWIEMKDGCYIQNGAALNSSSSTTGVVVTAAASASSSGASSCSSTLSTNTAYTGINRPPPPPPPNSRGNGHPPPPLPPTSSSSISQAKDTELSQTQSSLVLRPSTNHSAKSTKSNTATPTKSHHGGGEGATTTTTTTTTKGPAPQPPGFAQRVANNSNNNNQGAELREQQSQNTCPVITNQPSRLV